MIVFQLLHFLRILTDFDRYYIGLLSKSEKFLRNQHIEIHLMMMILQQWKLDENFALS
jgi:hypothetical protein